MTEPKRCPGCKDRRIQTYRHDIADGIGCYEPIVWQCCGCGALLSWQGPRVVIDGYRPVVLPGGISNAPSSYSDGQKRKRAT